MSFCAGSVISELVLPSRLFQNALNFKVLARDFILFIFIHFYYSHTDSFARGVCVTDNFVEILGISGFASIIMTRQHLEIHFNAGRRVNRTRVSYKFYSEFYSAIYYVYYWIKD